MSKRLGRLLFLTFSALVANPRGVLYTVTNAARGMLNRENITKIGSLAAPRPPTLLVQRNPPFRQNTPMARTTKRTKEQIAREGTT